MLRLEPFRISHLNTFEPGKYDRDLANLLYYEQGWEGKAVSARCEGRTVGICGIAVVEGVAHVWLALSDEIRAMPVTMSRWAKRSLGHIRNLPGVERVEIETGYPEARKWAEWLGFESIDGKRFQIWH